MQLTQIHEERQLHEELRRLLQQECQKKQEIQSQLHQEREQQVQYSQDQLFVQAVQEKKGELSMCIVLITTKYLPPNVIIVITIHMYWYTNCTCIPLCNTAVE